MTMAVLVLQAFAGQGRSSCRPAKQKTARAHVGRSPYQVTDALEAEHRVINEKRDRVDPVIRVCGSSGDKRADRSRLGDSFLKDLSFLRLFVIEECVHIHRLVM